MSSIETFIITFSKTAVLLSRAACTVSDRIILSIRNSSSYFCKASSSRLSPRFHLYGSLSASVTNIEIQLPYVYSGRNTLHTKFQFMQCNMHEARTSSALFKIVAAFSRRLVPIPCTLHFSPFRFLFCHHPYICKFISVTIPLCLSLSLSVSISTSLPLILWLCPYLSLSVYLSPSPFLGLPLSFSLSLSQSPSLFLYLGLSIYLSLCNIDATTAHGQFPP